MDRGQILTELVYNTSRSSGPGGQNVNKVETKVEVRWNIEISTAISMSEKTLILTKLQNKLSDEGTTIIISSQAARSQAKNKEKAAEKLLKLIEESLIQQAPRKATKPTAESIDKRIKAKKSDGDKKSMRGNLKNRLLE
jgi:ribosome-associated protein